MKFDQNRLNSVRFNQGFETKVDNMFSTAYVHIDGIKPADEKYKQMKAVWDSCKAANIEVPKDVLAFFNLEDETDSLSEQPLDCEQGVRVPLACFTIDGTLHKSYTGISIEEEEEKDNYGFAQSAYINLSELPEDVGILKIMLTYS